MSKAPVNRLLHCISYDPVPRSTIERNAREVEHMGRSSVKWAMEALRQSGVVESVDGGWRRTPHDAHHGDRMALAHKLYDHLRETMPLNAVDAWQREQR